MIVKGYIYSILYVALCIVGAILLQRLGVPKKYTRKFVHILVGFEWVILYFFMGAGSPHFLMVCLIFFALLALDYKLKLLAVMSSDESNAPGTVYYAVAMSVMAAVTMLLPEMIYPFGIGVFCTSFGDGLAGVVGQAINKNNPKIYGDKTLMGTAVNLAVCFAVSLSFSEIFNVQLSAWHCLIIAFFATEIELLCGHGLDNIALTLGSAGISYLLVFVPAAENYIAPIVLTPIIIAFAYKKRALTLGGIFAAVFMDVAVSIAFGNAGFLTLITFFIGSILIDKFKKHCKNKDQDVEFSREKRGEFRDIIQVLANGLVASVLAVLYINFDHRFLIVGFAAALAEAFADTAASGIGVVSKRTYDIFRMRKCESGLSGGMSLEGTVASLAASFVVAAVPLGFGIVTVKGFASIGLAGFLGAVFDSLLGSLFQVKYKCSVCEKILEREEHCGEPAVKYRGFEIVNNDAVNFLSTLFSATVAILIFVLT